MNNEATPIFLVSRGEYSDYEIVAIFTTRELAEEYIYTTTKNGWKEYARVSVEHPFIPMENRSFDEWRTEISRFMWYGSAMEVEEHTLWSVIPALGRRP